MEKQKHLKSILVSMLSVIVTLFGYFLVELNTVDFGAVDPLMIKGLLISIAVRSLIKLVIDNSKAIQAWLIKVAEKITIFLITENPS